VRPLLKQLHRQIANDAKDFLSADDATRHRTRKRLKRLRYSIEFVAPLFPAKALARYLAPLRRAQDALGVFNDMAVAEQVFRAQLAHEPRAWFAIGWLAARRASQLRRCALALGDLSTAKRFWKG
jgi:triphosphatase